MLYHHILIVNYLIKRLLQSYISELSGLSINKEDFTSKNLPFFGSHIRQSGISNNNNIVENHTGIESFTQKKNTPIPLFEPTVDKNINYGTQNKTDEMKNRFVASRYKKGELPFQQVRVGPGIDNDDLSGPTGGFHQDTRKHIIPKSIDDLRPKSNPQISYKGRVIPGKAINSKIYFAFNFISKSQFNKLFCAISYCSSNFRNWLRLFILQSLLRK